MHYLQLKRTGLCLSKSLYIKHYFQQPGSARPLWTAALEFKLICISFADPAVWLMRQRLPHGVSEASPHDHPRRRVVLSALSARRSSSLSDLGSLDIFRYDKVKDSHVAINPPSVEAVVRQIRRAAPKPRCRFEKEGASREEVRRPVIRNMFTCNSNYSFYFEIAAFKLASALLTVLLLYCFNLFLMSCRKERLIYVGISLENIITPSVSTQ